MEGQRDVCRHGPHPTSRARAMFSCEGEHNIADWSLIFVTPDSAVRRLAIAGKGEPPLPGGG